MVPLIPPATRFYQNYLYHHIFKLHFHIVTSHGNSIKVNRSFPEGLNTHIFFKVHLNIYLLVRSLNVFANFVALFEVCIIKVTLLMCEVINEVGLGTVIQSSLMWQAKYGRIIST